MPHCIVILVYQKIIDTGSHLMKLLTNETEVFFSSVFIQLN